MHVCMCLWKPSWQTWCTNSILSLSLTDKKHFASASSSYLCGICVHVAAPESLRCACFPAALITSREMRETLRTKQHPRVNRYESGEVHFSLENVSISPGLLRKFAASKILESKFKLFLFFFLNFSSFRPGNDYKILAFKTNC